MTEDDLDLVETDTLIAALGRRFEDNLVLINGDYSIWYFGGAMNAIGLMRYAEKRLLQDPLAMKVKEDEVEDKDGDED